MRYYSNTSVETTLSVDINAVTTSIQIGDTTGLPVTYPYTLVIDYEGTAMEVVTVTSSAGPSLLVTRGQDGTSAQSHTAGARVVHAATARDFAEPQEHIADSQDVHGIGVNSFVVGTETTQTLINKTIDGGDNTLQNISWSSLGGDGSITIDGNTGGNPAILVDPEPGNGETGIEVIADAKGVVITRESGGTGNLLEINSAAPAVVLSVTDAGLLTTTDALVTDDLEVDGTSTLSHTTVTQDDPAVVGLLVTAHDTPTTPACRILADNAVAGLEVRRTAATSTTSELVRFSDQVGGTLAQVRRDGAITTTTFLQAGTTITAGTGLTVTSGGATITAGNVTVTSGNVVISAGGVSATAGSVEVSRSSGTDNAFRMRVGSEASYRLQVNANGLMEWGPGSSTAVDTNLYRSAANILKTDDDFQIKEHLAFRGEAGQATISFTAQTSASTVVNFGTAFPNTPRIVATIATSAGAAAGWFVRTSFQSTTGFTINVNGPSATWASIPIDWVAVAV